MSAISGIPKQFDLPLSMRSVEALVGKDIDALVYGTQDCGWCYVMDQITLAQEKSPITGIYDCCDVMSLSVPSSIKRTCKATLDQWALQVLQRKDQRFPLIFAFDRTGNPYPPSAETVLSKTKIMDGRQLNSILTHSEIRHLAKLCTDETIDEVVRAILEKNVFFVRVKNCGKENELERMDPPWRWQGWQEQLKSRKQQRSEQPPKGKKEYDWRKEFIKAASDLRAGKKDDSVDFKEDSSRKPDARTPDESIDTKLKKIDTQIASTNSYLVVFEAAKEIIKMNLTEKDAPDVLKWFKTKTLSMKSADRRSSMTPEIEQTLKSALDKCLKVGKKN